MSLPCFQKLPILGVCALYIIGPSQHFFAFFRLAQCVLCLFDFCLFGPSLGFNTFSLLLPLLCFQLVFLKNSFLLLFLFFSLHDFLVFTSFPLLVTYLSLFVYYFSFCLFFLTFSSFVTCFLLWPLCLFFTCLSIFLHFLLVFFIVVFLFMAPPAALTSRSLCLYFSLCHPLPLSPFQCYVSFVYLLVSLCLSPSVLLSCFVTLCLTFWLFVFVF